MYHTHPWWAWVDSYEKDITAQRKNISLKSQTCSVEIKDLCDKYHSMVISS